MNNASTPPDSKDDNDSLPFEPLKAEENLTGGIELDWTTPYVQYLTHEIKWESDLPEEEKKLITYCTQFFTLKEGELHRIFHNNNKMHAREVCERLYEGFSYTRKLALLNQCYQTTYLTRAILVAHHNKRPLVVYYLVYELPWKRRRATDRGGLPQAQYLRRCDTLWKDVQRLENVIN